MHIRWLKGVNTKHESQSSLEELTSWKMDAAVLDWNVSWVFDIENSPRDKPFSCVIKMENKPTESLGAFPLLSLMIISTEVHISEQSCKVNTIFFYSPLKESQITSLVLLRPQWVIPHASWMEWGYFHDILFKHVQFFNQLVCSPLVYIYIHTIYRALQRTIPIFGHYFIISIKCWCHMQYIIYFCFLGQAG